MALIRCGKSNLPDLVFGLKPYSAAAVGENFTIYPELVGMGYNTMKVTCNSGSFATNMPNYSVDGGAGVVFAGNTEIPIPSFATSLAIQVSNGGANGDFTVTFKAT